MIPVIFIIIGSILMVGNIIAYVGFINSSKDIIMKGKKMESVWEIFGLVLLVFFLFGYIGVAVWGKPNYLVAAILFFGAIFVSLVLLLMYYLVDKLKDRCLEMTETLISVVEARDSNLNGHSRYVQNLSKCLLKYVPAQKKEGINPVNFEFAALLHDIGKLGVPESILNKPTKLDEAEWAVMRKHPEFAMHFLKSMPSFDEIKDWILFHHERVDGKGYYGKTKDEIPYAARMIAVCDTYSAITMKRSYHEARSYEDAMAIIQSVAGTQLDEEIANIFMKIPKEELLACIPETLEL